MVMDMNKEDDDEDGDIVDGEGMDPNKGVPGSNLATSAPCSHFGPKLPLWHKIATSAQSSHFGPK